MPLCSVVIATHQRLPLLQEALTSALSQTDVDVEVLVVENGSTDGTVEYLRSHADERVRPLIHAQPLGATEARNTGLREARGDWLGFLDDDDLWAPGKLRAQLDAAAGSDWVYTGCVYIDGARQVVGGAPPLDPDGIMATLPTRYTVPAGTSSVLWRAGALPDGGLLDARLTYMVDWDLCQRLARLGPPAQVRRPLVAYRQHGANMSVRAGTYLSEMAVIDEKFPDLRGGRPLDAAYQQRVAGSESLRAGARGQAAAAYLRGMRQGDVGSLLRAGGLLVPQAAQRWLRRRLLSDEAWMDEARAWLRDAADLPAQV